MAEETATRSATLDEAIHEAMAKHHVPAISVGILNGDDEIYAAQGVTNVENPLEVDADTLFQTGSTTKTITGTALMRMVEEGKLDLDVPLRTYLPDLALPTEEMSAGATARHLLTHTGGWLGDYFTDQGRGDDALSLGVATLKDIPVVSGLGEVWSYNNAGFYLAGLLLEALTDTTYEAAARDLVIDPLGMDHSFFFPEEVMTYRFAAGHQIKDDRPELLREWALPRVAHPAGGLASSARDQLKYARFHLGDGTAPDGTRLLKPETMRQMQTPEVPAMGGGQMGLTWFIREYDGLRTVAHGGGTNGQISAFVMVPERHFAFSILTNATVTATTDIGNWILEHYFDVKERLPEAVGASREQLTDFVGSYTGAMADLDLTLDDAGITITQTMTLKGGNPFKDREIPENPPFRADLSNQGGLLVSEGQYKGMHIETIRNAEGAITYLRLGGRLYPRSK